LSNLAFLILTNFVGNYQFSNFTFCQIAVLFWQIGVYGRKCGEGRENWENKMVESVYRLRVGGRDYRIVWVDLGIDGDEDNCNLPLLGL
jgi:hypothetical protein